MLRRDLAQLADHGASGVQSPKRASAAQRPPSAASQRSLPADSDVEIRISTLTSRPFFERVASDLEVVKYVLLLTGALHGTKSAVERYLDAFGRFAWLWENDSTKSLKKFVRESMRRRQGKKSGKQNDGLLAQFGSAGLGDADKAYAAALAIGHPDIPGVSTRRVTVGPRGPSLDDFEKELVKFEGVRAEVQGVRSVAVVGALKLNAVPLKVELEKYRHKWILTYGDYLHKEATRRLNGLTSYMDGVEAKLREPVKSLDDLRQVVDCLRVLRERESSSESDIAPILDLFDVLHRRIPGQYDDARELDAQAMLRARWTRLSDVAEQKNDDLAAV